MAGLGDPVWVESPRDQFTKSKRNRGVEKTGLQDVLLRDPRFQAPTTEVKKAILRGLGLADSKLYGPQSFDAILLPQPEPIVEESTLPRHLSQIILVEMKTTKKPIKDASLAGFFFGATQREYDLAAKLGDRFRFAFVVLNSANIYGKPFGVLLTLSELEERTRSKRIQYQVNLWGAKQAVYSSPAFLIR
jgi:hypothetical protein